MKNDHKKVEHQTPTEFFDVVISGGGLSGCLTALSLADLTKADGSKLTIAVIESQILAANASSKKDFKVDTSEVFDQRVLALSHNSARYLKQLGLWQQLTPQAQPIEKIHISDRGHYGKARLTANDYQLSALGYVVEMSLLGKCLLSALTSKNNVTCYSPKKISHIEWQTEQVNITLTSTAQIKSAGPSESHDHSAAEGAKHNVEKSADKSIQTSLLLGCDGAQSICRKLANIEVTDAPYGQTAIIANVITERPHNNIAYERFTQYGPIAMLPLAGQFPQDKITHAHTKANQGRNACSLVWTLLPEQAQQFAMLDDSTFKAELEKAFGSWLGEITTVSPRFSYPLHLVQARSQTYHRMALVGNASHTIHPIAGQGFNLALRDIRCLASLIAQALDNNQDIGAGQLLTAYQKDRQEDHQQTIGLTDSLVTLFSNDLAPLVLGRTLGLKILNYVTPLKNALVKKTMGY